MAVLAGAGSAVATEGTVAMGGWQEIVRQTPYWESQGVHANLVTIRRWVLARESFCEHEDRHILFDRRATFLGWVGTEGDPEANQARINERRRMLAEAGRVHAWVPGTLDGIGYPFALACRQPDASLAEALARYTGEDEQARLWGTWDGMRIGSPDAPVSLHEAIRHVYDTRRAQGQVELPEQVLSTLAGKVIIESGGVKEALSPVGARGIMQLSPAALRDCELDARFHLHRIAQIDCALKLLEQNHRNLAPAFAERFENLPAEKAEALYAMLLLQAYHGGVGRIRALLTDEALDGAARYFAEHHARFSAGDIALGLIYHNLGRHRLGFASLYYATDVSIATQAACARLEELPGCD
jgi:hypothetical protein